MSEPVSLSTGALPKALAAFQRAVDPVARKSTAKVSDSRSYKYAELADIIATIKEPLADNGLAVTQTVVVLGALNYLRTMLWHISGEWVESHMLIPADAYQNPKTLGAWLTYLRRYGLSAILSIATEEDTDGATAEAPARKAAARAPSHPEAKILSLQRQCGALLRQLVQVKTAEGKPLVNPHVVDKGEGGTFAREALRRHLLGDVAWDREKVESWELWRDALTKMRDDLTEVPPEAAL